MRLFYAIGLWNLLETNALTRNFPDGKIRWVAPSQIHLTLNFLGEITDPFPSVTAALREAAECFSPFSLSWDRTGVFPNWRSPRILWIGLKPPGKQKVVEIGKYLGNPRIEPHVTVGRVKRPLDRASLEAWHEYPVDWPQVRVTQIELVKSVLSPQGAQYEVIAVERLKGVN